MIWSLISFLDFPWYGLYLFCYTHSLYLSQHALVGDDADCEVICSHPVVVPAHDFGC